MRLMVQFEYNKEEEPWYATCGTMFVELEVQREITKTELLALHIALASLIGPSTIHRLPALQVVSPHACNGISHAGLAARGNSIGTFQSTKNTAQTQKTLANQQKPLRNTPQRKPTTAASRNCHGNRQVPPFVALTICEAKTHEPENVFKYRAFSWASFAKDRT